MRETAGSYGEPGLPAAGHIGPVHEKRRRPETPPRQDPPTSGFYSPQELTRCSCRRSSPLRRLFLFLSTGILNPAHHYSRNCPEHIQPQRSQSCVHGTVVSGVCSMMSVTVFSVKNLRWLDRYTGFQDSSPCHVGGLTAIKPQRTQRSRSKRELAPRHSVTSVAISFSVTDWPGRYRRRFS